MKTTKPFWAKVFFEDFCAHFIGLTPEQRAADIQESLKDLILRNAEGESFGSKMVKWSQERIDARSAINKANIGKRWGNEKPKMPTTEELYDFCAERMLDETYAREWYEMSMERGGKDKNGKTIADWKGAVTAYVAARKANIKKGH